VGWGRGEGERGESRDSPLQPRHFPTLLRACAPPPDPALHPKMEKCAPCCGTSAAASCASSAAAPLSPNGGAGSWALADSPPPCSLDEARDILGAVGAAGASAAAAVHEDAAGVFALITRLRGALRYQSSSPFVRDGVEAALHLLSAAMGSLRSALSRNATICAGELVAAAGAGIAPLAAVDGLVAALLARACSDKRFIRGEAQTALRALATGSFFPLLRG
jgi:hypothetical protein